MTASGVEGTRGRSAMRRLALLGLASLACGWLLPAAAPAQQVLDAGEDEGDGLVQLDFNDVELPVVIDTIARLTNKNFIYDDRVRGRVTIVSPTRISVDQAYAVFESVLQVKGFTTVLGPGGALKVIPIRDAKESNIETIRGRRRTPDSDRFITRLIPLRYIDAEAITATLKPLVSKDASMVAYAPTNTVILTDAATNIGRLLEILESIDVETYKEELTVIKIEHADAATLAEQLSDIFGAEIQGQTAATQRRRTARRAAQQTPALQGATSQPGTGAVRILTDERTNSLIVLTSRRRIGEIRDVVARLDVPVEGGGRIHVYRLEHADAEELATTLQSLLSGQPVSVQGGGAGAQPGSPQALRAAITELAEGVTVTADPPTNSLVIQASKEGFTTLSQVISVLDVDRPQVLVEALIMEVLITDDLDLGFSGVVTVNNQGETIRGASLTGGGTLGTSVGGVPSSVISSALSNFLGTYTRESGDTVISAVIRASAKDARNNILSAPHILTSDNEEAEIKVGDNIPIITSRVQSTETGAAQGLATSVNVERQDIGVTLRVTPQISEGDQVRLEIFQEVTGINNTLTGGDGVGNAEDVGVALTNRQVQNTVVVSDGETVVIGGLIGDQFEDTVDKVPFLGDIPFLGWAFKTTSRDVRKTNLLVMLTPHIVRAPGDLEQDSIRKREEFEQSSDEAVSLNDDEEAEAEQLREAALAAGLTPSPYVGKNPVRGALLAHAERYPISRMLEIERELAEAEREAEALVVGGTRYGVLAAVYRDEGAARETLTRLVDAGYDGELISGNASGDVLLEVRLGPFESLAEAERVAGEMRSRFSLSPSILVEREGTVEP